MKTLINEMWHWLGILAIFCSASSSLHAQTVNYTERDDVRTFIQQLVEKHGFIASELQQVFSQARFQPGVIKAITPQPPQAQSWQEYRASFLTAKRIKTGKEFLKEYADPLQRASREYGVPSEIIVAIIGIESVFGTRSGNYRVIDALTTLAFDYPPRAEFFRSELEEFLLIVRTMQVDVLSIKGSYAGAIGIPQFMPASYRRFAVDFDGDGVSDLNKSVVDSIGSIGNFLKQHGWETDQPTVYPAEINGDKHQILLSSGIKPKYKIADLAQYGVKPASYVVDQSINDQALCSLVDLPTPNQETEYRIGLQNFYTLTRYNRSSFYAMAVIELAKAIKQEKN